MSQQTITLPLEQFVHAILGEGEDFKGCTPISEKLATLIVAITNNQHTCYIQWADEMSPHLTRPILWDMAYWRQNVDSWRRQKNWWDRERERNWIEQENIRIVAMAVSRESCIPLEKARISALRIIKSGSPEVLAFFGIKKLVTTIEEIK